MIKNNFYKMVSVANKIPTNRLAIATGKILVGKEVFTLIKEDKLPKGNALLLAEIAGINAAKETYRMLPLCHPLGLDSVSIYHELDEKTFSILIYSEVCAFAKTGVEMEALAAVNAALLSIYDLAKMVEPALSISDIYLVIKKGGKSGFWTGPKTIPAFVANLLKKHNLPEETDTKLRKINIAIVTISDRASNNIYQDKSGKLLKEKLTSSGANIKEYSIIPDEKKKIKKTVVNLSTMNNLDLVITTGGTGIGSRDVTYDALQEITDKTIEGFGELLRQNGAKYTKYAWLSSSSAFVINSKLVIILPGKPKAIEENMEVILDLVPHAIRMINNEGHD